jgi:hypothetical protein
LKKTEVRAEDGRRLGFKDVTIAPTPPNHSAAASDTTSVG